MRIGTITKRLVSSRRGVYAAAAVGTLVVFSLGVVTGEGRLRLLTPPGYGDISSLPKTLDYSSVDQIYSTLRDHYNGKLTETQILNGLKHGLADAANDPYTEYFTPQEAKSFNGQLEGISLTGIGVQLDQDADGNIVVMSPLNGSPAASAGILAKDIILTINGQSTSGMSLGTAADKIRGPKGSKVTLDIQRGGQKLSLTVSRDTITVPTASSKILDGGIGYLQVSQFSDDTFDIVKSAVVDFQQHHVSKLVLDLRDNPGGEVNVAQDISSLWLKENAVVMQEKRGGAVVADGDYRASGYNPFMDMPTVVLVNAGSASASEITALALHGNHQATIMGEKSYGKGVVQQVIPFSDGSELKVTIAKWYGPGNVSINHTGIKPDKVVPQTAADTANKVDTQLEAAKSYLESK